MPDDCFSSSELDFDNHQRETGWFLKTYPVENFGQSLLRSKAARAVGTEDCSMGRRDFLHKTLTWKVVSISLALPELWEQRV